MKAPKQTREEWLNKLAQLMAPRFEQLGKPIPNFRVSIGFTSAGSQSNAQGEAWNHTCSPDNHFEIFIVPDIDDLDKLAAILCHELIHTAVGFKCQHKGDFAVMMGKLGLMRPYTDSIPGDEFKAWVAPMLKKLGPIPHAPLRCRGQGRLGAILKDIEAGLNDDDDDAGGSSNRKKKQTTRMLKASCEHCGYTIRLAKKWALSHGATCPECGKMEIEGLDED
jgi:predicted RNA-binding Zn-ribbon protein involved in translation (DUF1610 family)